MTPETFAKVRPTAPPGFFAAEAAGLAWLAEAEADGGAPVVPVLEVHADRIVLPRLAEVPPTAAAAADLGRGLAVLHRAGAGWFGAGPPGHSGDGFIGPLPCPLRPRAQQPTPPGQDPAPQAQDTGWAAWYAEDRILPFAHRAMDVGAVPGGGMAVIEALCDRLIADQGGLAGPAEPPSRLHGDLWSGNILWTAAGAVLIDPSAHGGHRETDLAMLALFGLPFLDHVLAAYQAEWPLAPGWQQRVGLHQLYPVLVHAALFGGGYGAQAVALARDYT